MPGGFPNGQASKGHKYIGPDEACGFGAERNDRYLAPADQFIDRALVWQAKAQT